MGYTHYYDVRGWHTAEWQAAWPKLIRDVPLILEAADVLICGPCDEDEDFVPPIVHVDEGICFNGVAHDGHDTFCLSRKVRHHFVKTLGKPYDVAVACILLRAHLLAPNHFELYSDGSWDQLEWIRARRLYQELWPGEPIRCPWGEVGGDGESGHDRADGGTSAMAPNENEGPPTTATPNPTAEITDILKRSSLDSPSSSQLEPTKSTVSGVDFSHISGWLSQCEEDVSHIECKASPIQWQNLPGTQFKVIDIHRRSIVKAPEGCSFIALTYVWGGVDQPRLNAATAPLLMRDGGLDVVWSKIPTTIRDAIVVCEQLGERYLWVDALCIMQDSVRDMKLQILRMRQIYSAAKCAIVAVSAETAGIGLLGNPLAKHSQPLRACESEDSLNTLVESSPWSSRAWCYQEKVLSHRLILFTSNGIYMQCRKGTYDAKGTQLPGKVEGQSFAKFNAVGGMLSICPDEDLESYVSAVEYYSQRKLTKQEDKMDAFEGIFRRYGSRMDGKESSFCYGLPICAFDQTICWRTRRHNPHLRNQSFPSWSWLGWNDAVLFDRKMLQIARTSQIIYNPDHYNDDIEDTRELRKPASHPMRNLKFGFPTAGGGNFRNSPGRWLHGSVTDLRIALDHLESDGSNSLYVVFPNRCGQQPAPPPRRTISAMEFLKQPLPMMKWMDAEMMAAPSVPAAKQTEEEYNLAEHDRHEGCEAQTPLGYIWLDRKWREKQLDQCIMGFMALAGEKDPKRQGEWVITMLMCLQRMEKNGHFWARERVQVMDCEIEEERWLKIGAKVTNFKLT